MCSAMYMVMSVTMSNTLNVILCSNLPSLGLNYLFGAIIRII